MCKDNNPAGTPKIEITPEMIEAGGRAVRALLEQDYGVYYSLSVCPESY